MQTDEIHISASKLDLGSSKHQWRGVFYVTNMEERCVDCSSHFDNLEDMRNHVQWEHDCIMHECYCTSPRKADMIKHEQRFERRKEMSQGI